MKLFLLLLFINLAVPAQAIDSSLTNHTVKDSINISPVDSTSSKDSLKAKILTPIFYQPFSNQNNFINNKSILENNYRYAADVLKTFNFTFVNDRGFIGQPNIYNIYGISSEGVGINENGEFANNRFLNSYDLNLIQTESIDSVEIASLPKGFLYNAYNSPVSVNFIKNDFIPLEPYSRIKYYQGAAGEALVDGYFSTLIKKRVVFSFDITNRKYDSTYVNSDFSLWQGSVNLKYLYSNNFNFYLNYKFVNGEVGLNDGVNVDSVLRSNTDFNTLFYDENFAPVNSTNKRKDYKQHNFSLSVFNKFSEAINFKLNLYYKYDFFRESQASNSIWLSDENLANSYGANFRSSFNGSFFTLENFANFESTDLDRNSFRGSALDASSFTNRIFSDASVITFNFLNGLLKPSAFYKHTTFKSDINGFDETFNLNGYGADLSIYLNNNFKLYTGFSQTDQISSSNKFNVFEAGLKFNSTDFYSDLKIFKHNLFVPYSPFVFNINNIASENLWGFSAIVNYSYWNLFAETNTSFYVNPEKDFNAPIKSLPKVKFEGGLFYKDFLFEDHLNLKAGFVYHYYGKQFSPVVIVINNEVAPEWRLDFIASGVIDNVATVYLTMENIFDRQYYITPFFPMPRSNFRFGISWELFN